jgi:hypothetical protein
LILECAEALVNNGHAGAFDISTASLDDVFCNFVNRSTDHQSPQQPTRIFEPPPIPHDDSEAAVELRTLGLTEMSVVDGTHHLTGTLLDTNEHEEDVRLLTDAL